MRHPAWTAALFGLCMSAASCAAITGLDHIREDPCVPEGCEASADDASPGDDAAADTQLPPDTTEPQDGRADVAIDAPQPPGDAGDAGEMQEAAADVWMPMDAPVDAPVDSSTSDEEATDTGSGDHQDAPAPPDGPVCTTYYSEPFTGGAKGWMLDSSWTAASECSNPPTPDRGYPDPTTDHTSMSAEGGVIGVYVCGNNPKAKTAALYATSPAVDVSAAPSLKLTFYRWLNTDEAGYMTSTVDVFDGSTWQNVYQNPSSSYVLDNAWTKQEFNVTAYKNAAFQVRFGYSIPSSSVYAMSCWNVDDVTISTLSCP
jgi:hypothetical protein